MTDEQALQASIQQMDTAAQYRKVVHGRFEYLQTISKERVDAFNETNKPSEITLNMTLKKSMTPEPVLWGLVKELNKRGYKFKSACKITGDTVFHQHIEERRQDCYVEIRLDNSVSAYHIYEGVHKQVTLAHAQLKKVTDLNHLLRLCPYAFFI
jgi:hypothetical protein